MKTLLIIRHAKSSWDNSLLSDFDRPLNERGLTEAPQMAIKIKDRGVNPDCFVSSPAKRAKKTAKIFMKIFGENKKHLLLMPELYEASSNNFYDVVEKMDDTCNCLALFSHNPGITDFANSLTDFQTDNIPTSGVFAVSFENKSWGNFKNSSKKFLFFDFPKNH